MSSKFVSNYTPIIVYYCCIQTTSVTIQSLNRFWCNHEVNFPILICYWYHLHTLHCIYWPTLIYMPSMAFIYILWIMKHSKEPSNMSCALNISYRSSHIMQPISEICVYICNSDGFGCVYIVDCITWIVMQVQPIGHSYSQLQDVCEHYSGWSIAI